MCVHMRVCVHAYMHLHIYSETLNGNSINVIMTLAYNTVFQVRNYNLYVSNVYVYLCIIRYIEWIFFFHGGKPLFFKSLNILDCKV